MPKEQKYFMISNSGGDTTVLELTKPQLIELISHDEMKQENFMREIDDDDTNCWRSHGVLIIKGEVIVPKQVTTVTTFEID